MRNPGRMLLTVTLCLSFLALCGCSEDLVPQNIHSLFFPRFLRSEIFGFIAGFGTTFAALPDLFTMIKHRSAAGINPRMAAIMAVFQILWIYYGLLIASRPVIVWNLIAVLTNAITVIAYRHFRTESKAASQGL